MDSVTPHDNSVNRPDSLAAKVHISDPLLNVREAAEILDISVPTLWRRVKDGTLKSPLKLGSLSRWPRSEILAVIEDAKARRDAA